jgi:hypothetical protein
MDERELPAARPPKQASENRAITFETIKQVQERPPIDYLIHGLLSSGAITMILAEPKAGKSTFAAQLCVAAALGESFLGLPAPSDPLRVVILTPETDARDYEIDLSEISRDVYGVEDAAGVLGNRVMISEASFDVLAASEAELDEAVASLRKVDPDVVVLDSYYNFIDSAADIIDYLGMAERVSAIKAIARDLGCAILLIHHSRKAAATQEGSSAVSASLGSQALTGAVDTVIWLQRRQGNWTVEVQSRSRACSTDGWTLARPLGGQGRGFVEISETEARGLDPAEVVARLLEHATPLTDLPEPKQEGVVAYLDKHGHGHVGCLYFESLRRMQQAIEDSELASDGRRTREALLQDYPQAFIVLRNRGPHMVLMPSGLEPLIRRPDGPL